MKMERGNFCPLLKKDCIGLKCQWFIEIRGKDTNTGKDVDEWGCAVAWLPHLLIENANQTRQAGAATESFRNEMVNASEKSIQVMVALSEREREERERTMKLCDGSQS